LGPIAEGAGGGSLSNSQCTLTSGATAATLSGNNLTVPFNLQFYSGFGGQKTIFGLSQTYAGVKSNAGVLTALGFWTPSSSTPSVVSVTPNSGSGISQVFTGVFSDTGGGNDLQAVYLTIGSVINGAHTCAVGWRPGGAIYGTLFLFSDDGTSVSTLAEGLGGSVSNSQCTLLGGSTPATLTGSGDPQTLNVPFSITFASGYTGSKNILGMAQTFTGTMSNGGVPNLLGTWTP
jgi:hypothetical protein